MSTSTSTIQELANKEYQYGFVTDIESESIPRGLSEDVVRMTLERYSINKGLPFEPATTAHNQ